MRDELIAFFRDEAPNHEKSPEFLADELKDELYHVNRKAAGSRLEREAIRKAKRKIELALNELDGASGHQSDALRESLRRAHNEAGETDGREPVKRTVIDVAKDGEARQLTRDLTDPEAQNVRYLFALESFWFRVFNEQPSEYPGHLFYRLAEIVCSHLSKPVTAESLFKQRHRRMNL